jgi:hypothetical protein
MAIPKHLFAALVLGACGAPSPVAGPQAPEAAPGGYPIQLSRPSRAGDSYGIDIVAQSERRMRISVGGAIVEETDEARHLELHGTVRVRAVSATGRETVRDIEIVRCVGSDASGEREIAPAGSVLHVVASDRDDVEGGIELVGGALSEADLEILSLALSTSVRSAGDDEVFGTRVPQAIGARWPINVRLAASDLNKAAEMEVRPEQMSGTTTLSAREDVDGVECLIVRAQLDARGFTVAIGEDAVTEHAEMRAQLEAALPLDMAVQRVRDREALQMQMRVRFVDEGGQDGLAEMVASQEALTIYRR